MITWIGFRDKSILHWLRYVLDWAAKVAQKIIISKEKLKQHEAKFDIHAFVDAKNDDLPDFLQLLYESN